MKDLHHNIKVLPALDPKAIINANAANNGATIDRQGYEAVEFVVQSGVITDGTLAVKIQEGDLSNASDMADAAAADVIGTAAFAATDDSVTKYIGYKGKKRYSRVVVTQAGATTGGFFCALAILGNPAEAQPT
jgi:hypothetical protein